MPASEWYTGQLKRFINLYPRKQRQEAWTWVSTCSPLPWAQNTFYKYFKEHHAEYMLNTYSRSMPRPLSLSSPNDASAAPSLASPSSPMQQPSPPNHQNSTTHSSSSTKQRRAKSAAEILFAECKDMTDDENYEYVVSILNTLSYHIPTVKLRKYKLGETLQAFEELEKTFRILGNSKTYDAQQQKQIIGAALLRIDLDSPKKSRKCRDECDPEQADYIEYDINATNSNVVRRLIAEYSGHHHLLQQVAQNKKDYIEGNTSLLFDEVSCRSRTRESYPLGAYTTIDDWLRDETTPSPNTHRSNKVMNEETGKREDHCHHHWDGDFKRMYTEWLKVHGDILKKKYNLKRVPSRSMFDQRRRKKHKYIHKRPDKDYSVCTRHFNFESMTKALVVMLRHGTNHKSDCDLPHRVVFHGRGSNYKCHRQCTKCARCTNLAELLSSKPKVVIKALCCKNGKQFPSQSCWRGKCKQCGVKTFKKLLFEHGHDFEGITLRYEHMRKVEGTGVISEIRQSFEHFIDVYYKVLKAWVMCHFKWIRQNKARKHDLANLADDEAYWEVDYIHSPKVLYYSKSTAQWGGQKKFAFCMFHEGFNDAPSRQMRIDLDDDEDEEKQPDAEDEPLELVQETTSYYCKDTKHDWSTALQMVRRNVQKTKRYFKDILQRPFRRIRAWSDNGEFECTGFIQGLAQIEKDEDIDIVWSMKQSQHGKGSADGYGHHDKSTQNRGVMNHELIYNEDEDHVVTVSKFMERKDKEFRLESHAKKKRNRRKLRLMKYVAVTEDLEHFKSGEIVQTLKGISELNCFVFCNRDGSVMKRYLTCNCAHCKAGRWTECDLRYVYGDSERYEFTMVTDEERQLRKEKSKSKKRKASGNKENVQSNVAQSTSKRRRLNSNQPLCVASVHNLAAPTNVQQPPSVRGPRGRARRGGFMARRRQ